VTVVLSSGVITDPADPAMPAGLWGPKILALIFFHCKFNTACVEWSGCSVDLLLGLGHKESEKIIFDNRFNCVKGTNIDEDSYLAPFLRYDDLLAKIASSFGAPAAYVSFENFALKLTKGELELWSYPPVKTARS